MLITAPGELGQLIRDQRNRLGISQQALALAVGVSRHWVIALERGNAGAELGLVLRALSAVGLRMDLRAPGAGPHDAARALDAGVAALHAAVNEAIERTRAGKPPRQIRLSTRRKP
ncbi:MAG TPA: helix-turn-helix domain-containing protein [Longimicrobiaceae bacterium]|nr:helix-turn-helix domain-containing protein [Longimicrobiaceae bacterium]